MEDPLSTTQTEPPSVLEQRLMAAFGFPLPGVPAQERMAGRVLPHPNKIPPTVQEAGVLLLLQERPAATPSGKAGSYREPHIILIQRTEDRGAHSRQIAFPGGRRERGDASLVETALREAEEEIGMDRHKVKIGGALTPLYIPVSNFMVYPFVGFAPSGASFTPQPTEVARILPVPLSQLFALNTRIQTTVAPASAKGKTLAVPAYQLPLNGPLIWGATAMMLSEFEVLYNYNPLPA